MSLIKFLHYTTAIGVGVVSEATKTLRKPIDHRCWRSEVVCCFGELFNSNIPGSFYLVPGFSLTVTRDEGDFVRVPGCSYLSIFISFMLFL